jgi:phosphoserine phosphatase
MMPLMTVLHIFDMDGTLLPGTTANLEVARQLGTLPELRALEALFAAGKVDTRVFSAQLPRLWARLTPGDVVAAYREATWLGGIAEVCADIRARGEHSVVITMSPDFFAGHLLGLGFDEVIASRFPPMPFAVPLDLEGILTPEDKVRLTDRLRAERDLSLDACVAYGDSLSDAPLFRHLKHTVAVNADHHLADLAAVEYRGTDLLQAYRLARTLLPAVEDSWPGPVSPAVQ